MKKILLTIMLTALIIPATMSGQWDQALHFTWQEHDRVLVPDSPSLFPFVLNAGTVELWFKPDTVLKSDTHAPDYTYLFCKNISGNNEGDMGLSWKRGDGRLQCFIQNGEITQDVYPGSEVWESRWHHIAFVWDTEDSMRVFIDGVQSLDKEPNSADEVCIPVYGGTQVITIGSGALNLLDDRFETFRGTIDEVRISAVSRYQSDFTPPTQPYELDAFTVALWHFDEGSGDIAADATGNGFTGTLGDPDSSGYADPEWVKVQKDLKIIFNEVLADPATSVELGDANGDSVRNAQEDEFVELMNVTQSPLDLTGWKVGDDERIDFQFPDGYTLNPFEFVVIFGGGDVTNVTGYDVDPLKTKVFATGDSVGNGLANSGDYIILQSPDGNHDMYFAYGSKFGAGPPTSDAVQGITWEFEVETAAIANNNNSITRSPDANIVDEDPFVEHNTVSSDQFSPGTTIAGETTISFTLSVSALPASGGTVSVEPDTNIFLYGQYAKMTATPADSFVFGSWTSGTDIIYTNPINVPITENTQYTANFVPAFEVTPTIIVNEILADPSSDPILGDANGDGIRHSSQDEFVELLNIGNDPVDMSGWQLGDDEQISFTFPSGYMMNPGQIVAVFGGGDITNVPGYNADPLLTRVFVSDTTDLLGNGLANSGDFILLFSQDGSYDLYAAYNSKYNLGPPTSDNVAGIDFEIRIQSNADAGNNNSITRSPDGDISVADPFAEHNTVSDNPFSPAQTIDGNDSWTTIEEDGTSKLPFSFKLLQNYPNPFNPTTSIAFEIPQTNHVLLTIYNTMGQKIKTLVNTRYTAGHHIVNWNGRDVAGNRVSSGVYFYRIKAGSFSSIHKMILLK